MFNRDVGFARFLCFRCKPGFEYYFVGGRFFPPPEVEEKDFVPNPFLAVVIPSLQKTCIGFSNHYDMGNLGGWDYYLTL